MKKTDDYLKHAKDCRGLAKKMLGGEQRDQLMKMAETWEVLARERERTLRKEIAAATRELNYAHGTERQLSDTTIPTGFEMQRARRHILREIDRVLCQIGPAKQEQA